MNIYYKALDYKDKDQLRELLEMRPHVFNGYTDDKFKDFMLGNVDEFFNDSSYFMPGVWADDKLIGTLIAKESAGSPSWVWGHWVSRPNTTSIIYSADGNRVFKQTDQELFNEMETRRGLNRFFVAYKASEDNTHLKNTGMSDRLFTLMSRLNFRVSRYKFITDCEVEAGEEAKYAYQRAILGDRIWPFKVAVRMGVLIQT